MSAPVQLQPGGRTAVPDRETQPPLDHLGFDDLAQLGHHGRYGKQLPPPGILAPHEGKHILHELLKMAQTRQGFLGEAATFGIGQIATGKMGSIKQRRRQRRAQLVGETRRHLTHGREPLVSLKLLLKTMGLGHVVQEQDAPPRRIVEAAAHQTHPPPCTVQLPLQRRRRGMQPGRLDLPPRLTEERLPQHGDRCGVDLLHPLPAVQHHHARGQSGKQVGEATGERFLLQILSPQLAIGHRQLGGEALHFLLELVVGLLQLGRRFREQGERLFQVFRPHSLDVRQRVSPSGGPASVCLQRLAEVFSICPMAIVAIFNQKGGVGKTTTSLNLTAAMVRRELHPLAIDLDPQSHLTAISDITISSSDDSVFGFYKELKTLSELVHETPSGAHVIPAHFELSKVDSLFGKGPKIINRLKSGIEEEMLEQEGMPVIIDCCPMLGVLSLNAIFAATKVLVPISTDFLAVKGAQQLERTLKALEHVLKKRVERRYVVTRFDGRRKLSWEILEQLRARFGEELCETRISENVSLTESPAYNRSVFEHAPHSQGAKDYEFLLEELIETGFL